MIADLFIALEKDMNARIIVWRKLINKFFLKEYGFILRFEPKIEGEDNE